MKSPLTEHEKPPHHPGHSRVHRAATVQGGDPAADQTGLSWRLWYTWEGDWVWTEDIISESNRYNEYNVAE